MERTVSNTELYEKIDKIERDVSELKDLLFYVRENTSKILQGRRGIAEQFGINVISNIIADELIFRPLKHYRGES